MSCWTGSKGSWRRRRRSRGGYVCPLGAGALYLITPERGGTVLHIQGTNGLGTLGMDVSNGSTRLVNEQVIDLYERVPLDTGVVLRQKSDGVLNAVASRGPLAATLRPRKRGGPWTCLAAWCGALGRGEARVSGVVAMGASARSRATVATSLSASACFSSRLSRIRAKCLFGGHQRRKGSPCPDSNGLAIVSHCMLWRIKRVA